MKLHRDEHVDMDFSTNEHNYFFRVPANSSAGYVEIRHDE